MKKVLALLLALMLLMGLVACTGEEDTTPTDDESTAASQPEDEEEPKVTPAKYTRNEFLARLEGYMGNHKPDQKSYYEDGYDPEQENGYKELYIVKDFDEEHMLNLFGHDNNLAVGKQAKGWVMIDKFKYQYQNRTKYSVSLYYTVPCENLVQAGVLAKNDVYCLAPFYGYSPSSTKIHTTVDGQKVSISLTEEDIAKLASGAYTAAIGTPGGALPYGDSCRIEVRITPIENGRYEYTCKLQIEIDQ